MFDLYPHQQQVIDELRAGIQQGHNRQILAMATGAGKTVVAGHIALNAVSRGKRVLFIVHLKELVGQAFRHFDALGLRCGILQGENTDYTPDDQVVIASIQTIRSRSVPDWIDVVIIDEAHILYKTHIELMEFWSALPFVGLSATPLRQDLGKYFTNLVRGPTVAWLTENGFLVPARAFCPGAEHISRILDGVATGITTNGHDFNEKQLGTAMNQKELVGDIVSTWKDKGEDRQTLCFAVNKAHSRAIVEDLSAEGITAAHIEDRTPDKARRELIDAFREREIRILSSVGVLAIGFDVPNASCMISARPTLSEALDLQQKGRVIRPAEGKTDAVILDHSGNVLKHGLPIHFEVPNLGEHDRETPKQKKQQRKMASCANCGFALEPAQFTCPSCGIDRPSPTEHINTLDGQLVEYGSMQASSQPSQHQKQEDNLSLLWYAHEHGYSDGWAYHKYCDRFDGEKPPWAWKRLPPTPASPGLLRWIRSRNIRYAKRQSN